MGETTGHVVRQQFTKDLRLLSRMVIWVAVRVVIGFSLLTLFSREGNMCPEMTLIECLFVTW